MKTKLVFAWFILVGLAIAIGGSCSIKHQSEQYECETTGDCAEFPNRVCSEGLCVEPGGTKKDAAVDAPNNKDASTDALICPSQCTQCNLEKRECTIDCNANPSVCGPQVVCPPGFSCIIKCNTSSSCRNGVMCQGSLGCNIECSGSFACRNVQCGTGPCLVNCSGNSSCSGITCGMSCACDVKCGTGSSCFNVICSKPQCSIATFGCSSEPQGCDTCP